MSAVLGKRKSRHPPPSKDELDNAQAIFQRNFEAMFAPLPETNGALALRAPAQAIDEADSDDDDDDMEEGDDSDGSDSGWGGVSDEEEDEDEDESEAEATPTVQIIDHSTSLTPTQTMTKRELKALLSSRIPDSSAPSKSTANPKSKTPTTDPEDAPSLLAADMELHRLITESHLLTDYTTTRPSGPSNLGSTSRAEALFSSGRLRQRTTDLRLQSLSANSAPSKKKGAAASLFAPQKKMPMAMRKGIVGAAAAREAKRRAAAKEEGVVLERATGGGEGRRRGMNKGVGSAMERLEVGRMRGAELRLSKRDVMAIQGPKKVDKGRKKKRR